MKEIKISPVLQLVAFGTIAAVVAAAVAAQLPELKRYLKIRSM
jgi:hypothetical protein